MYLKFEVLFYIGGLFYISFILHNNNAVPLIINVVEIELCSFLLGCHTVLRFQLNITNLIQSQSIVLSRQRVFILFYA